MLKYTLIAFGPEVYFPTTSGTTMFTPCIAVDIMVMSSFDIPTSMSFNVVALSAAANPILNTQHNNNVIHYIHANIICLSFKLNIICLSFKLTLYLI